MIGQIGPLVQVGSGTKSAAAHIAGGVAGGAVAGLILGVAGALASDVLPDISVGAAVMVGALGIWAALADLGVVRSMGLRDRQTPQDWQCVLGRTGAAFGWGVDVGLGVTTRLPYLSLVTLFAIAALSGSILASTSILAAYGLGKTLGVVVLSGRGDPGRTCDAVIQCDRGLRAAASAAALCAVGLYVGRLIL
jgi:hypothetical protein